MFADSSLAARIERAEATLSADIGFNIIARGRIPGSFVEPIGGGFAVFSGAGSPINKVIGVGFADGPDVVRLDAIEALFAARGSGVQAEVATLADPAWHAAFAPRGYALAGFENVLGLSLTDIDDAADTPASRIVVTECDATDTGAWLDVVVTGFAHPDEVPAQAAGQEYPRDVIEQVYEISQLFPASAATWLEWTGRWPAAAACGSSKASPNSAVRPRCHRSGGRACRRRCSTRGYVMPGPGVAIWRWSRRPRGPCRSRTRSAAASPCSTRGPCT